METLENGMEEQLREILLDKLKKSVKHFGEVKSGFSGGMESSIQSLALISEFYGEIKVLIDIVAKSNMFLGYDGNGINNLSFYQKIEKEALNKRNKIFELNRNRSMRELPYDLKSVQPTLGQSKQTSNGEKDTVTISANELNELVQTLKSAINIIQDNAEDNAKSNTKRERSKVIKGDSNPNFNNAVDTNKLYEEYEANGFHLPNEMCERYKKECGITMQGLRKRLIMAGKWKGRSS